MNTRSGRLVRRSGLALLFFVCAATSWLVMLAVMAEPEPARDYSVEANAILDRALPEGSDATPLLVEAMERAQSVPNTRDSSLSNLMLDDWSNPRHADEREMWDWLLDEAVPPLQRAAQRDVLLAPFFLHAEGVTTEPHLHRQSFSFLRIAAVIGIRHAAEREDWDELVAWVETALGLFRLHIERPVDMDLLIANSIWSFMVYELRLQAIEGRLPAAVIDRLIATIESVDLAVPDIGAVAELHHFEQNAGNIRYFTPSGIAILWMMEPTGWSVWHGYETPPLSDRVLNVRALLMPRRSAADRELAERIAATTAWWKSGPEDPWMIPDAHIESRFPSGWRGPYVGKSLHYFAQHHSTREINRVGTLLALRIAAHRAEHGRWPEFLADAAAPEETINPLTGDPFEYALTPDDADGAPYRLATTPPPGMRWREWLFSEVRSELEPPYTDPDW